MASWRNEEASFDSVHDNNEKLPRIEDLVEVVKLPDNEWLGVRTVGPVTSVRTHWLKYKTKKDGKSKGAVVEFGKPCLAYDRLKGEIDTTKKCPYCNLPKEISREGVAYYVNAIIRDIQEDEPAKKGVPSKLEAKTGFKEKGSKVWTPVRVVRLPGGAAGQVKKLKELNKHKTEDGKKAFPISHTEYGCDIMINFDKDADGAKKYSIQKGDASPLTDEEQEYLLWDIQQDIPEEDRKSAIKEAARVLESHGGEESEDEDLDDDDGDEDDVPAKKKPASKKKPVVEEDDDDDFDDEDEPVAKKKPAAKKKAVEDEEDDDSFDDEDDEPAPKAKAKKKPVVDEDDDFDDEDDEPVAKSKAKPAAKKKAVVEDDDEFDDEDDEPAPKSKAKKKPVEDDDFDDEDDEPVAKKKPASKKKPVVDEDDDFDEEDDEPAPKAKGKKKPAVDEDDDFDEEDEAPAKKPQPKQVTSKGKKAPPKGFEDDEDDDLPDEPVAKKKPAAKKEAPAAKKKVTRKVEDDEDDDFDD